MIKNLKQMSALGILLGLTLVVMAFLPFRSELPDGLEFSAQQNTAKTHETELTTPLHLDSLTQYFPIPLRDILSAALGVFVIILSIFVWVKVAKPKQDAPSFPEESSKP